MAGEEADICFTSPPYAQQRDYKSGPQDWLALMQGVFAILHTGWRLTCTALRKVATAA
jgi:DNA modification methylase